MAKPKKITDKRLAELEEALADVTREVPGPIDTAVELLTQRYKLELVEDGRSITAKMLGIEATSTTKRLTLTNWGNQVRRLLNEQAHLRGADS